jgi:hypothetical protein
MIRHHDAFPLQLIAQLFLIFVAASLPFGACRAVSSFTSLCARQRPDVAMLATPDGNEA